MGAAYADVGQGINLEKHNAVAVTGSYNFGRVSIGGGYQKESDIAGIVDADRTSYSAGASAEVFVNHTIKAQYAISETDVDETTAKLWAVGYDYAMDKQTTIYLAYAKMVNDLDVAFSVNGKGHGDKVVPLAGDDPTALSLGIVYKFDSSLIAK